MGSERVRPSPIAGSWYPGDRETLARQVDGFLDEASLPDDLGAPLALIAPHAGYRFSGACAGYAYASLRGASYRLVIILAPSHRAGFRGASVPDYHYYATPLGKVPVEREICRRLEEGPLVGSVREAHREEHSLEIQLPFLQRVLGEFTLVPVLLSAAEEGDLSEIADALRPFLGEETLVVASSDFTHYGDSFGYVPFREDVKENLARLDGEAIDLMLARDFGGLADYHRRTGITACGIKPIQILLRLLPPECEGKLLRYYTSGDLTGDWGHCVSYAAIAFGAPGGWGTKGSPAAGSRREARPSGSDSAEGLSLEERRYLLDLARRAMEAAVHGEGSAPPGDGEVPPTERLRAPGGAFVTLIREGRLRGCIGYLEARMPLYSAVAENAVNAALHDHRFPPVGPSELGDIQVEISVLTPPRKLSRVSEFEVGPHGIILEKGPYRAVYLPQVAPEQGWDREETLDHLAQKAGLPPDGWREGASFFVFTAEVFAEGE